MMKSVWESRKRIIGLGAIALLALFMMNLNSRLSEYFHLTSERDKLALTINDLRATKIALDTQAAYATSDAAVEEWARNEAHMARPGDKVIVPVTPDSPVEQAVVESTPPPPVVENWQVWWALFFEEE